MKAVILSNRELAQEYCRMQVSCSPVAREARPGTFVTIQVSQLYEPLLRRPFTIYSFDPGQGTIDLVYRVVGAGTLLMSAMREGQSVDLLGPLGNGFTPPGEEEKFLFVAGGTGVAALYALAQSIKAGKENAEITLLMGGAGGQDIICLDDFRRLGARVMVATEDGSMGDMGLVTDLLEDQLHGLSSPSNLAIYSCGPRPMLKEVARQARRYSIPCTISLEARMGCGIGACLGCVIKTIPHEDDPRSGESFHYKRICRDGPVFDAAVIDWEVI